MKLPLQINNVPQFPHKSESALTKPEVVNFATKMVQKIAIKPDHILVVDDSDTKLIQSTMETIKGHYLLSLGADLSQLGLKNALRAGGKHEVISRENEGLSKFQLISAQYALFFLMRAIQNLGSEAGREILGGGYTVAETELFEDLARNLIPKVAESAMIQGVDSVRSVMQYKETLPEIFVETLTEDGNPRTNFVATRHNLFQLGVLSTFVDQVEEHYGVSSRDFILENYDLIQSQTDAPAFISDYSLGELADRYGYSVPVILANNAIASFASEPNQAMWTRTSNPKSLPLLQTAYQWGLPPVKVVTPDLGLAIEAVKHKGRES